MPTEDRSGNRFADLIYDVGLFDGADTAYYLHRGYKVVSVDANPLMIERAQARFATEIASGRLKLLNVGISDTSSTATFWVSDNPEWSSFDRSIASRNGTLHRGVDVPTMPFREILATHGVPHYLKIDIEGRDTLCVADVDPKNRPTYISVESECAGEGGLDEGSCLQSLELLRDRGYTRFKLVNQGGWIPVRHSEAANLAQKLLNSAARGRLKLPGLSVLADRFTDAHRVAALGYNFEPGSSGPWGEDVPGPWMNFDEAKSTYVRHRRAALTRERLSWAFWYDWHATY